MIVEIFFLGPCAACERRSASLAARHRRDDQNFWPRALGDSLVLVQPGVLQVPTVPGSFERARVPACHQTLLSKYQGKGTTMTFICVTFACTVPSWQWRLGSWAIASCL